MLWEGTFNLHFTFEISIFQDIILSSWSFQSGSPLTILGTVLFTVGFYMNPFWRMALLAFSWEGTKSIMELLKWCKSKKNSFLCPIASWLSLTEEQLQILCSLGARVFWKSHAAPGDKLDHQKPCEQHIPIPVLWGYIAIPDAAPKLMNPWHLYLLWILARETRYIRSWVFLCPSLLNKNFLFCFCSGKFRNLENYGSKHSHLEAWRDSAQTGLYSSLLCLTLQAHYLCLHSWLWPSFRNSVVTQMKRQCWCCLFEFCLFWDKAFLYTPGWPGISYGALLASNLLQSSCLWLWSARITDVCTWGLVINTDKDWSATWPSKWQQFQTIPLSIKTRSRSTALKVTWTI